MKRRDTTLAEEWQELERRVKAAWLAILHSLGLHTRAELNAAELRYQSACIMAEVAAQQRRQTERLLVLLSEPLKDWDLADFPEPSDLRDPRGGPRALDHGDAHHLANVLDAYRLTASDVASLRMRRVVDDKARRRGWGDEAIRDAFRPPAQRRNLP